MHDSWFANIACWLDWTFCLLKLYIKKSLLSLNKDNGSGWVSILHIWAWAISSKHGFRMKSCGGGSGIWGLMQSVKSLNIILTILKLFQPCWHQKLIQLVMVKAGHSFFPHQWFVKRLACNFLLLACFSTFRETNHKLYWLIIFSIPLARLWQNDYAWVHEFWGLSCKFFPYI